MSAVIQLLLCIGLSRVEIKDKTVKINPNYYSAWVCLAITYYDDNNNEKAIEYLKHGIELEPDKPNGYMLLANILIEEKRYEEALMLYKISAKLTDNNAKILTFIANTYVLLNDIVSASIYYKKAIKKAPKDNEIKLIYLELANNYIEKKMRG